MSYFSNSTSRLMVPNHKRTAQAAIYPQSTLATSQKYASTEGRFTILDKKFKESSDSSDSASDSPDSDFNCTLKIRKGNKSVRCTKGRAGMPNQIQVPTLQASSVSSGSRFKIVPVESRYQRGRWLCFDYYGNDDKRQRLEYGFDRLKPSDGLRTTYKPLGFSSENNLSANMPSGIAAAPALPVTAPTSCADPVRFAFGDDSDSENVPCSHQFSNSFQNQFPSNSGFVAATSMTPSLDSVANAKPASSTHISSNVEFEHSFEAQTGRLIISVNNGCITPSEMLNYGLERSLSTGSHNDKSFLDLLPGGTPPDNTHSTTSRAPFDKSVAASGSANTSTVVAIDSKIEQAMDLVKTHLMFAVREEVEMLRAKIIELEATVLQLDAENTILREHVPADVLSKINLQMSQPNSAAAAV